MNELTKLFSYNGNEVTFRNSDGVAYVNATEMAKPFGKRPSKWLELPTTSNFLSELEAVRKSDRSELIKSVNGVGTWLHEDVALEFSRWLSPAFSIWCNDRIKELLSVGMTATPQALEDMLSNPDLLIGMATQLKDLRARNQQQQKQIEEQKPKVLFADAVATSKTSILVGELAKLIKQNGYDIGQNRLFDWLRTNGYLINRKGTDYNMPTQRSMDLGLFEIKENTIAHSDGHTSIIKTPKVTGKGQLYFVNKFLNILNNAA